MTLLATELAPVVRRALSARLRDVHVGMPGRVVAYDADRQCVDVQPLVLRPDRDEAGDGAFELLAVVNDVPVVFPGGGGYGATFPLEPGDDVWLSFASCDLETWKLTGGETAPGTDRRFTLSDAVAHVGVRDLAHPRASAPTDCARMGHDTGAAIEFREADVRIGGGPAPHEATIKADTYLGTETPLLAQLAALAAAIVSSGVGPNNAGVISAATAVASLASAHATAVAGAKTTVAKVR